MIKPKIYNYVIGISSTQLTPAEVEILETKTPYGIILFSRNVESSTQLSELTSSIKQLAGDQIKIFVDQEGGRVVRIKEPIFSRTLPSAEFFRNIYYQDQEAALKAIYLNYYLIGVELKQKFNIDGVFAPVCDLQFDWANNVIGDRSFGINPEDVVLMAKSAYDGLIDAGTIACIKHIPGHGRALLDSHYDLPKIETDLEELENTDFLVFKKLNTAIMAMTAHIVYTKIDQKPVTISKKSIDYIREKIGFKNLIITDDLSMQALKGSVKENAQEALKAGCDILLHCNGKEDEIYDVAEIAQEFIYNEIENSSSNISFEAALQNYNNLILGYRNEKTRSDII